MIFDAGVFIALDNPADRRVVLQLVRILRDKGEMRVTNDAALAQAWRDPTRQVPLTKLLKGTTVHAASETSDVVDASLAVLAAQLDESALTTDPDDMQRLGVRYVSF